MKRFELNLRDLGGIPFAGGVVPKGLFLRSGKLCILTEKECAELCRKHHIACVIDVRTPIESAGIMLQKANVRSFIVQQAKTELAL